MTGSRYPPDCELQYYHSTSRIAWELFFCLAIVLSYVPQYIKIWRTASIVGISSRYILFHGLCATSALCIQFGNEIYFDPFNCVNGGTLRGWQAMSALTGNFQVISQWACGIILVFLSLKFYNENSQKETEQRPILPNRIKAIVGGFTILLVPICVIFLWHNDDSWTKPAMSWGLVVYTFILRPFLGIIITAYTAVFCPAQFWYQIQLLISRKSRGSLSIISVALLSAAFIGLTVLQILRSAPNLDLKWKPDVDTLSQLVYFHYEFSLFLGYLFAGLGNFALFVICVHYNWREIRGNTSGAIHLA